MNTVAKVSKTLEENEIDLYTWFRLETALQSYLKAKLKDLPPWAKKKGYSSIEELKQTYIDRLTYEFAVIKKMGFCGYFLIVADGVDFCRKESIPVGPGRGSAAGCLCSFLLRITKIDPIKYDLLFERFLNPDRYSMPDIDTDFSQLYRHRIKEHYTTKYGANRVASIGTFSRMKVRAAVKDIVRSLNLAGNSSDTFRLADKISKTLEEEEDNVTYAEALKSSSEFRAYMQQYPIVAQHVKSCENVLRQMSMHAAGVLISALPLDQELPLIVDKKGMVLTAYDGKTCEGLGYLKLDTLGLKNLDIIADCRDNIKRLRGSVPRMEMDGIDIEPGENPRVINERIESDTDHERKLASKAFRYLREKSTLGIFQCEQPVTQDLLRKGETNSIEDVAAILALIRPGPRKAGSTEVFISRKRKEEPISYIYQQTQEYNTETGMYDGKELVDPVTHDLSFIKEICDETQGLPLFQEQLMKIAVRCAGFTKGESDVLRKAVGKKDAELIAKTGTKLIEALKKGGELNTGCKQETADFLWKKFILPYGSYGFNLSHSIAYGFITYETAWLKANFPGEFYAALLSHESDQEKVNTIISEAKAAGIRFLTPDVNKSTSNFRLVDPTTIVYSLTCMHGVGDAAVQNITGSRPYKSMVDFIGRAGVNSSVTNVLIKGGAFDNTFENERFSRKNYYDFFEDCRRKLKRQTDRLLREALLKQYNYPNLKGDAKKEADVNGTYETPAAFHKRMYEENSAYKQDYDRGELEEIARFEYDWNGPITVSSKGVATAVERESGDDRVEWTLDEILDFEEEIFGTTLSSHRLDPYTRTEQNFLNNAEQHNLEVLGLSENLSLYSVDQEVFIFCQGLRMLTKFAYKKDPKSFVRTFEIEDRNGKGKLTVFEKTYRDLFRNGSTSCFSILDKKTPYRPVMILKCKINDNRGMRGLALDSVLEWTNESQIKEAIKNLKVKELETSSEETG